jgi:hypothetical protein
MDQDPHRGRSNLQLRKLVAVIHKGQMSRFLDLLERAVAVAERWANAEYPIPDDKAEAEIYRQGEERRPETPEEYEAFESQGRFAKRYRAAHPEG